jgi:hypothetical protein
MGRTHLRAKRNGHSLHSYGRSPVCALRCRPTCCGLVNVAAHSCGVSYRTLVIASHPR